MEHDGGMEPKAQSQEGNTEAGQKRPMGALWAAREMVRRYRSGETMAEITESLFPHGRLAGNPPGTDNAAENGERPKPWGCVGDIGKPDGWPTPVALPIKASPPSREVFHFGGNANHTELDAAIRDVMNRYKRSRNDATVRHDSHKYGEPNIWTVDSHAVMDNGVRVADCIDADLLSLTLREHEEAKSRQQGR